MKLLLIEDQPSTIHSLYHSLNHFYTIHIAPNARTALEKLTLHTFDIITLDLGLPDMYGSELCEIIRSRGITAPILVVSSISTVQSKVSLLDIGADDYITKPFDIEEIRARLRSLLRSRNPKTSTSTLEVGDLILNTSTRTATRRGVPIHLRRKEYAFLECLMQNAGQVVSRSLLEALVWDDQPQTMANTIHVQVNNLRRKIDRPFGRALIHTVHGVGYRLDNKL